MRKLFLFLFALAAVLVGAAYLHVHKAYYYAVADKVVFNLETGLPVCRAVYRSVWDKDPSQFDPVFEATEQTYLIAENVFEHLHGDIKVVIVDEDTEASDGRQDLFCLFTRESGSVTVSAWADSCVGRGCASHEDVVVLGPMDYKGDRPVLYKLSAARHIPREGLYTALTGKDECSQPCYIFYPWARRS